MSKVIMNAARALLAALLALAVGCGDDGGAASDGSDAGSDAATTGADDTSGEDEATPGAVTVEDALSFPDWAAVLDAYGRGSCFDYRGLLDDPSGLARLERAVEVFAAISPEQLPDAEARLAYWINAYNVLMVWLVTQHFEHYLENTVLEDPLPGEPTFRARWFAVAGEQLALDDIEHGVLRLDQPRIRDIDDALSARLDAFGAAVYPDGRFDVRIHFAVNCASVGCPDLRTEPYVGARVDAQLEEQTVQFLNDPVKGAGPDGISSLIGLYYLTDFDDYGGVEAYVTQYNPDANTDRSVGYDWTLNQCP